MGARIGSAVGGAVGSLLGSAAYGDGGAPDYGNYNAMGDYGGYSGGNAHSPSGR